MLLPKSLWALTEGQRTRYVAAIVALVIGSCFLYLAPLVPQIVLDGVLSSKPAEAPALTRWAVAELGGRAWLAQNLWLPALLMVAITGLAGVFTYLRGRWSAAASESIVRRVRDQVFDHLQRLPCGYFDGAETGDLIQRCTSDVETLRQFLRKQVVEIGRAVVMLLIPLPLMLAIDWRMTLASICLLPPIFLFSLVFFRRVRSTFKDVDEAEGRMTSRIQENLAGLRVVRAFARQAHEEAQFGERNLDHRQLDYRLYSLLASYWSLSDMLCFVQKAIVVGAGVIWLAAGTLQVGAFFYFLTAATLFIWPIRMMGRILTDLGKALVSLERLDEVLTEAPESEACGDAPTRLEGAVELSGVSFAHGEQQVLHDVSLRLEPGQTLGIVGASGSGKTTIVNLLLRLYDYEAGSIRLDGRELSTLDRRWVRARIAVVLQEPFLYSKTLGANIGLGRPEAARAEVEAAARDACVHEAIESFEDGYETRVGERGVTLSGGQRQRVALARALVQEPALLILDDSLSAVDAETETSILEALRVRRGKHTTIVIAHRLSAVAGADRILVLDEGRVVQAGTHAQLVDEEGPYRRLWTIQTSMGEDEQAPEQAWRQGERLPASA